MDAGRELDAQIAERVFDQVVCRTKADIPEGWRLDNGETVPGYCDGTFVYTLPHYSDDIAAAWQVVEKMVADGWAVNIAGERGPARPWDVRYWRERERGMANANTLPMAVCNAALYAVTACARSLTVDPA